MKVDRVDQSQTGVLPPLPEGIPFFGQRYYTEHGGGFGMGIAGAMSAYDPGDEIEVKRQHFANIVATYRAAGQVVSD